MCGAVTGRDCGLEVGPAPMDGAGADDGTRTRNRRFTKPLLYQLSYVGDAHGQPRVVRAPGDDRARSFGRSSEADHASGGASSCGSTGSVGVAAAVRGCFTVVRGCFTVVRGFAAVAVRFVVAARSLVAIAFFGSAAGFVRARLAPATLPGGEGAAPRWTGPRASPRWPSTSNSRIEP